MDGFVIHYWGNLLQRRQTANVLADDVELEVHECARLYAAEVGVLECVGNYRHRESVVSDTPLTVTLPLSTVM